MKWKFLPHSSTLILPQAVLDELSKAQFLPSGNPCTFPNPWLERGGSENWHYRCLYVSLRSLRNWRIRQIPRFNRIRRLRFWGYPGTGAQNVLQVEFKSRPFWHSMSFSFTFVWRSRRCYEASFYKGLSKYLHISVLIYLGSSYAYVLLEAWKYNFTIWN